MCNDDEKFVVYNDGSEFPKLHKAHLKKAEYTGDSEVEEYRKKQYEIFLNSKRPIYEITEKMALRSLREEKRACPSFFSKGVRKEDLLKNAIEELREVYKVSNGFYIGDEVQIFSVEEQNCAQKEFDNEYQNEKLTNLADYAKIIGKTVDGDWLLLLSDGKIARYLMGEASYEDVWSSLWEFIHDVIGR